MISILIVGTDRHPLVPIVTNSEAQSCTVVIQVVSLGHRFKHEFHTRERSGSVGDCQGEILNKVQGYDLVLSVHKPHVLRIEKYVTGGRDPTDVGDPIPT